MHSKPNVIVLIIDALRARNLSSYGYSRETTPGMDAYAAKNILFERAFTSATWTIPVHTSLLTGLYLSQHRIENVKANRRLNPKIVTLPKALLDQGYRTAAFSQNSLFSPEHNFDIFEEFHEVCSDYGSRKRFAWNKRGLGRLEKIIGRYKEKIAATRLLFDKMLRWVKANDGNPFLMVANCTAVHYAWAVPLDILLPQLGLNLRFLANSEFYDPKPFHFNSGLSSITEKHREIWSSLYDGAIKYVDREVSRFLDYLNRWSGHSNTIVVITSDHGEMLGESQDIFGHTLCLHDNILHVPLIIRHPDYKTAKRVEGVVQTFDLYPSILEWCAVPLNKIPSLQLQRPPLSKAISNSAETKGFAFAEEDYTDSYDVRKGLLGLNREMDPKKFPSQQIAIRSAMAKYIWRSDQIHEFYDLVNDPNEKVNLIDDYSKATTLHPLQRALEIWRSANGSLPPIEVDRDVTTDPEVHARLKMLGYIE